MEDIKKFVEYLSERAGLKKELVEKDVLLHLLLVKLKEQGFFEDYLFKGGTCLIKCYLNYYRFSVDLDFTSNKQVSYSNKSNKKIKTIISEEVDRLLLIFKKIADESNLRFEPDKKNKDFVMHGGSSKMLTFKMWYDSILGTKEFIKIQINFKEKLLFNFNECEINSLHQKDDKLAFLFPEIYKLYSEKTTIKCYDIKEILAEKIRAIMTRKGVKERDFIDVYYIVKKFKINLEEIKKEIIEKIIFSIELYKKYKTNIKEAIKSIEKMEIRREEYILIEPLDTEYSLFEKDLRDFLLKLFKEIETKLEKHKS